MIFFIDERFNCLDFLHFQELATKEQYYERLLGHGINCHTQSFLVNAPLLDQNTSDSLDLRPMLEPALTKSLFSLTDQKGIVEKNLIDRNITKKWEIIEHIYEVMQKFYETQRESQRILKDGNVSFVWKECSV